LSAPAGLPPCRITRVETWVVGARWLNWVLVRVHTDEGITGVGEGTCEWQATAVEAAVRQLAHRYAIGRPAFAIEALRWEMFRNEFARGGPILNSAIAALEMALWDIKGKALGVPVFELLGGALRTRIPAYANAWYGPAASAAAIAEAAAAVKARGYRGLKLDPFENCGRDPDSAQLFRCLDVVAAVRAAVGPEMEILIDAHGRFSPGTAIRIGRTFEELDVYWFEEPTDCENLEALAEVGRAMRVRLATGERIYTRHHLPPLLATNQVRVLQPDPIHVGGLLEAFRIAGMADACYLPVSFHNPFGPVATACCLQLDACVPNFVMQESFCEYTPAHRFDLVEHAPRPRDGGYDLSDRPGLGVGDLRPEVAEAHPYDPDAFLPMWGGQDWRRGF
jgi:galactonate dehydratase